MKRIVLIVVLFVLYLPLLLADSDGWRLKCEYLEMPLGVDVEAPRLIWRLPKGITMQRSYRVVVGMDSVKLVLGQEYVWDSGRVLSSEILIKYGGEKLAPFTKYWWKVFVWDEKGCMLESYVSSFETGMQCRENWKGYWISDTHDINLKPAAYFRKTFHLDKKVKAARAYIAVAGLYELSVNGYRIDDQRLTPTFTRFDRRILYLTHDITARLKKGDNAIGVWLGNGWYNLQSTAVWNFDQAPWRGRPKFCMDLYIIYNDGTSEWIVTDDTWKTSLSPVEFNSIYTAEHYDARKEQAGWNSPEFDDCRWKTAYVSSAPAPLIVSQQTVPIRDVETLRPVKVQALSDSVFLYDFGRNIAGVTELTIKGKAGMRVQLKHAERIKADGHVDMANIDYHYRPKDDTDPFQTDIYVLKCDAEETFRPRFNYKGFRYVEVICDRIVSSNTIMLKAYFMHSDVEPVGTVSSSDEMLNKIWAATNASYLSNLFGYPTDCPQREKNGWTGDAHIAIETGLYNYDGITVYEKWLADHQDEQAPNGVLPAIIPTSGWGYHWGNGVDWTSTIAIIPWNIYLFYGDTTLLSAVYDNIKRYVDYLSYKYPSGITDWGLGDWIPIKSKSNKSLTSSVYFYVDTHILAKAARLLGRQSDYEKYSAEAQRIRDAINDKFLNRNLGIYCSGTQTELSVPLYWEVVPEDMREKVAENLARKVKYDGCMDVGLLGSKAILCALSMNGYSDLAWQLASRDIYPSWGWWIKNGATTLYENWRIDGNKDISLNHIMFGEISAWYYKVLGGILPDELEPGFKRIVLRPHFVSGLNFFSASHVSPYGEIKSAWKRQDSKVYYQVVIPSNSYAILYLPAGSKVVCKEKSSLCYESDGSIVLQAGTYHFEL